MRPATRRTGFNTVLSCRLEQDRMGVGSKFLLDPAARFRLETAKWLPPKVRPARRSEVLKASAPFGQAAQTGGQSKHSNGRLAPPQPAELRASRSNLRALPAMPLRLSSALVAPALNARAPSRSSIAIKRRCKGGRHNRGTLRPARVTIRGAPTLLLEPVSRPSQQRSRCTGDRQRPWIRVARREGGRKNRSSPYPYFGTAPSRPTMSLVICCG